MTIRHLSVFKTVCEEQSFTKAAKKLYMTQPAISHVISDLEKEAGSPLFDRIGKRIYLNQRGKLLLEKSIRLLELYEDVEQSMGALEQSAVLRIGSGITIANFWLPHIVKEYEKEYKAAPIEIQVDSALKTAERLARGEIDIALIEGGAYISQFEAWPFSSYQVSPMCAPGYLPERVLTIEEFASQRLLLREKGSAIRDVLDGAFLQQGLAVKPFWTSVNSQALLQAAKKGIGITVLPPILARRELEEKSIVEAEIKGVQLKNENHIAVLKGVYLTEAMKRFIEIVKKSSREITV